MIQQTNTREIRIRYTWKRKEHGHIYQTITPIECLEGNGDKPFLGNELWEMIGRDLSTGLKDKNNKEIYESDFVKVGEKTMQVIFDNGCFYTPHAGSKYRLGGWKKESIEIIGNVFENTVLLH